MEEIITEELEIERKLKELESKCEWDNRSNYKVNLREIQKPEDANVVAVQEREKALVRNAQFLQEVDIQVAKLHTKRLCPLQKKLDDLKDNKFGGVLPVTASSKASYKNNNNNNNNSKEPTPTKAKSTSVPVPVTPVSVSVAQPDS